MKVPYAYLNRQFVPELPPGEGGLWSRIMARIEDVAMRGDFTLGREVAQFEDAWCEVTGARYAVGVSNGTDAIALALIATDAPDAMSVPANSFVATAGAVLQSGRKLRFIDVDDETMNVQYPPHDGTIGVLPVAWCGLVPKGYAKVVDGAQAIGAKAPNGLTLTEQFTTVTYSLHPLKNINVWGDGGMVTTNSRSVADELRLLRNHGLVDRDHIKIPGYNHRLSTMQAAVGIEVLKEFPFMWERRHEIASLYHLSLNETRFRPAQPYDDISHAYHVFQIRVPADERDRLLENFKAEGVDVKIHYPIPLHKQEAFAYLDTPALPNVEQQAREIITLPMHEYLTDAEVAHVCDVLKRLGG